MCVCACVDWFMCVCVHSDRSDRARCRARETDCGALVLRLLFRKYVRDLHWSVKLHPTVVVTPPTHAHTHTHAHTPAHGAHAHPNGGKAPAAAAAAHKRPARTEHDPALDFVHGLLELLDAHIAGAAANLAQASQRTPMHGVVLALRYVTEEADLRGPAAPPRGSAVWGAWRAFFVALCERVKAVFGIALKVVGGARSCADGCAVF